jgi:hypothetical protein
MDIGAFLAQLAIALSPYAAKGAGQVAEKLAEDVYGKAKGIVGKLRDRLRGMPAEAVLTQYEAAPLEPANQQALAEVLRREAETQPDLQRELLNLAQSLVDTVKAANQAGAKYQVVAN